MPVVVGGILSSHKGINVPTGTILAAAFTEKDREDLLFGIQNGVDLISLSYVRDSDDIKAVKNVLRRSRSISL